MGAHARPLSRLRLKFLWLGKPEINGEVGPFWQYRTVLDFVPSLYWLVRVDSRVVWVFFGDD